MPTSDRHPLPSLRERRSALYLVIATTSLLAGCAGNPWWLPAADRITIQQGNLVSENRIESVQPGMPQEQVRSVLGSPVVQTPFHDNRWDYVFTRGPAGEEIEARRVTVYFDGGVVSRIEDNWDEESGERPPQRRWWEYFSPERENI